MGFVFSLAILAIGSLSKLFIGCFSCDVVFFDDFHVRIRFLVDCLGGSNSTGSVVPFRCPLFCVCFVSSLAVTSLSSFKPRASLSIFFNGCCSASEIPSVSQPVMCALWSLISALWWTPGCISIPVWWERVSMVRKRVDGDGEKKRVDSEKACRWWESVSMVRKCVDGEKVCRWWWWESVSMMRERVDGEKACRWWENVSMLRESVEIACRWWWWGNVSTVIRSVVGERKRVDG
jgi:hypothetical protein